MFWRVCWVKLEEAQYETLERQEAAPHLSKLGTKAGLTLGHIVPARAW
jgi:hypothetical protein